MDFALCLLRWQVKLMAISVRWLSNFRSTTALGSTDAEDNINNTGHGAWLILSPLAATIVVECAVGLRPPADDDSHLEASTQ